MSNSLEQLIRSYVKLSSYPNNKGWFSTLCKVCNDHGHKGNRAAFKFDEHTTGYNCFNCGIHAAYDSLSESGFTDSMQKVLNAWSIPKTDWGGVLHDSLHKQHSDVHRSTVANVIDYEPKVLDIPSYFYRLTDDITDEIAQYAIQYLREERSIDWTKHDFFLAKSTSDRGCKKWLGRLIIPIYKKGELIFYQGRDLTDTQLKKYESPSQSKSNVLFGFDHILSPTKRDVPLYVVEGWFDAFHLNGVAVLGNAITKAHTYWLNQSGRQKVIIPDRFGNGLSLATEALSNGWSISTPDIGNCKDINEAVNKYGILYVLNSIREHTYTGFEATTRLGVYCER